MEVGLHRDVVDEDAKEPVEGEHGGVDAVLCEVGAEPRQLFRQQLLQDLLVHLGRKNTISVRAFLDKLRDVSVNIGYCDTFLNP